MLRQIGQGSAAAVEWPEPAEHPSSYPFTRFCQRNGTVLLSDPELPGIFVAHRGADFMFYSSRDGSSPTNPGDGPSPSPYASALADILAGHIAQDPPWPDALMQQAWERAGQRYIFVNTSPLAAWEAGLAAGFTAHPEHDPGKSHVARLYWFSGAPRFAHLIRHSVRLGRGQELAELLRRGVGYDAEGEYVRAILASNPSFVVEAHGAPVSWSTVHLNGTLGMIYTPEEHRRRGYARSLCGFQVDHELRRTAAATGSASGFACCHVVAGNTASENLLLGMGARVDPTGIVWRMLYW